MDWYSPDDPKPREVCPCCDYVSLAERGHFLICRVCFWEDDGPDMDEVYDHTGANRTTLREARANFEKFGACDENAIPYVCSPEERARYERRPRKIS